MTTFRIRDNPPKQRRRAESGLPRPGRTPSPAPKLGGDVGGRSMFGPNVIHGSDPQRLRFGPRLRRGGESVAALLP